MVQNQITTSLRCNLSKLTDRLILLYTVLEMYCVADLPIEYHETKKYVLTCVGVRV